MSLIVHRAPRADDLVAGLAELLSDPLPDPFEQELVLVPAKGIERWLSQQLSHRLGRAPGREDGVCAGVRFRSPHSLVSELTGAHEHDPWAPDALVWPLLTAVDASAGEPWCAALSNHLGHGQVGEDGDLRRGRRYSVARRLAGLFASYAVQRPSLLADWEQGRSTDGAGEELPGDLTWQPELWRRIVQAVGEPSPVQRNAAAITRLRQDPDSVALPQRFSLFGHTRIPATEVALLDALGASRDVHLWLPHPSDALWHALSDLTGAVPRAEDESHERVGHPLLSSLGRDLRELQRTLGSVDPVASGLATLSPQRQSEETLLSWLQDDIAANATTDPAHRTIATRRHQRPGARLPRTGTPGRGAPRGTARSARGRPLARAARHPGDVPGHRGLRPADHGSLRDGLGGDRVGQAPPGPPAAGDAGRPCR